jgi:hypothetical protein
MMRQIFYYRTYYSIYSLSHNLLHKAAAMHNMGSQLVLSLASLKVPVVQKILVPALSFNDYMKGLMECFDFVSRACYQYCW